MSNSNDLPPAGSEWRQRAGRLPKKKAPKQPEVGKRSRGAAKAPRRFHSPELIQAAFMAGRGMTGEEIAIALGNTTGPNVRAQLRHHGVRMARGLGMAAAIPVRLSRGDCRAFHELADNLETDPVDLAAELLRALTAEPTIVRNLLDIEVAS